MLLSPSLRLTYSILYSSSTLIFDNSTSTPVIRVCLVGGLDPVTSNASATVVLKGYTVNGNQVSTLKSEFSLTESSAALPIYGHSTEFVYSSDTNRIGTLLTIGGHTGSAYAPVVTMTHLNTLGSISLEPSMQASGSTPSPRRHHRTVHFGPGDVRHILPRFALIGSDQS